MSLLTVLVASWPTAAPCGEFDPVLLGRWPYGQARAVAVSGTTAYLGVGAVLQILDISNPWMPVPIGSMAAHQAIENIEVAGEMVYLADGEAGLCIVDASDPSSPVGVGAIDFYWDVMSVAVTANTAFVANNADGLRIVDVTDPAHPEEIGSFKPDGLGLVWDVAVEGSFAYLATAGYGHAGLWVVDISSDTAPEALGFWSSPGSTVRSVEIDGDVAYLQDQTGLHLIDVEDRTAPHEIGHFETVSWTWDLDVSEGRAYSLSWCGSGAGSCLAVVDVSDPRLPVGLGEYFAPGFPGGIVVEGDKAFLAFDGTYDGAINADSGLRILDVSAAGDPSELGIFRTPGVARAVAMRDSHVFVGNAYGLRVLEVGSDGELVEVGDVSFPSFPYDIVLNGSYAFVASSNATWLQLIDISAPEEPRLVGGTGEIGIPTGVAVWGSYAYLSDLWEGLRVIDVSDTTNPFVVGSIELPGTGRAIAVSRGYAFVAVGEEGVRILDVSYPNHASPVEVASIETIGEALDVEVEGGRLFVMDMGSQAGLRIFDVSVPTMPMEVLPRVAAYGNPIAVDNGFVYLAQETSATLDNSGVAVVDVNATGGPRVVGSTSVPGTANDVAGAGCRVVVAELETGVEVYGMPGCTPPVHSPRAPYRHDALAPFDR